jgi:phosphoribosylaminoimidazole (AIR) synthetase
MVLIVERGAAGNIMTKLAGSKQKAWSIGEVVKGDRSVEIS